MNFWKMHGIGNDFIVVDNTDGKIGDKEASILAVQLCNRRYSIGADGLILVCRSTNADVKMRMFNIDGSEAEMCGNGIRCLAKYCYEAGLAKKLNLNVETLAGIKTVWLTLEGESVKKAKVNMGKPSFDRSKIPMVGGGVCINEDFKVNNKRFKITCLSIGNPHCIVFVENLENFPVQEIGPRIENHPMFPKKVNAEFVKVLNRKELAVRVWERGCGETLACGTGACASMAAANKLKKIDDAAVVHLPGGALEIKISEGGLLMDGNVEKVFEGTVSFNLQSLV